MVEQFRRSFLYAPADDLSMMEKTAETDADAVIFDLEDAVHPSRMDTAWENISKIRETVEFGEKEVGVRINGLQTDYWLRDLKAAIDAEYDAIKIPMVEHSWHARTVVETASQLDWGDMEIILTLETPKGVFNGREIAESAGRLTGVTGLSFGLGDYTNAIGAPDYDTDKFNSRIRSFLLQLVAGYSALGNLDPIASAFTNLQDDEALRQAVREANALGFIGQSAIHPDQLEVINETFTPDDEEIETLLDRLAEYEASEKNSMVVDGAFLDEAIVARYERRIARHEAITE